MWNQSEHVETVGNLCDCVPLCSLLFCWTLWWRDFIAALHFITAKKLTAGIIEGCGDMSLFIPSVCWGQLSFCSQWNWIWKTFYDWVKRKSLAFWENIFALSCQELEVCCVTKVISWLNLKTWNMGKVLPSPSCPKVQILPTNSPINNCVWLVLIYKR